MFADSVEMQSELWTTIKQHRERRDDVDLDRVESRKS